MQDAASSAHLWKELVIIGAVFDQEDSHCLVLVLNRHLETCESFSYFHLLQFSLVVLAIALLGVEYFGDAVRCIEHFLEIRSLG